MLFRFRRCLAAESDEACAARISGWSDGRGFCRDERRRNLWRDWAALERMDEVDEKMMLKAVGLEQPPHRVRSCERAGDTRDSYAGKFFSSQKIFTLMFGT